MGTAVNEVEVPVVTEATQEAASAEISKKLELAYALIRECEEIALKQKVTFSFDVAYGMGGTFSGDPEQFYSQYSDATVGWQSSSQSC